MGVIYLYKGVMEFVVKIGIEKGGVMVFSVFFFIIDVKVVEVFIV